MMILVSGGSGSGKSAFAEALIVARAKAPLHYLATMELWDAECEARAEKHRQMRAGKGFSTIERPKDVGSLTLAKPCAVLLEDLSNLVANEVFAGDKNRIFSGIQSLDNQADLLVIVTNELFSDGITYDEETEYYLNVLATLNRQLAVMATEVYEVVAGIPICWKETTL